MAFRERVKRVLGRNSSSKSSSSSSLSKKPSKSAEDENHRYYLPGEKMPPMKYRRPVAKEHKEKLEAFNFEKAWRRRSQQSVYSPMGSRIPSRRNSLTSRKSMNVPRSQVVEDLDQAGNTANGRSTQRARDESRLPSVPSGSEHGSEPETSSRPRTATSSSSTTLGHSFTQQDLNHALRRSRIEVPLPTS